MVVKYLRLISILIIGTLLWGGCVSSSEHQAKVSELKKRMAELEKLKKENERLDSELRERNAANEKLMAELKKLEGDRNALEEKSKKLSREIIDLDLLVKKKKKEESESIGQLKDLESKLKELQSQVASRSAEFERLQAENKKLLEERDREVNKVKETYDKLVSEMKDELAKGEIEISRLRDSLKVTIVERLLFSSGSTTIRKQGLEVLERAINVIGSIKDKEIQVAGHTDSKPIGWKLKKRYQDNWDLSVARAAGVARYLQSKGVPPDRLSAVGYSQYRPQGDNKSAASRRENRRIEIVLTPLRETKTDESTSDEKADDQADKQQE